MNDPLLKFWAVLLRAGKKRRSSKTAKNNDNNNDDVFVNNNNNSGSNIDDRLNEDSSESLQNGQCSVRMEDGEGDEEVVSDLPGRSSRAKSSTGDNNDSNWRYVALVVVL